MKTAAITKSWFKKEHKGTNGTLYYHLIELDNGDKGEIGSKTKDPEFLGVGKSLDYTITKSKNSNHADSIKRAAKEQSGGYKEDPKLKLIGMAMSYSKDLVVAKRVNLSDMGGYSEKIFDKMMEIYNK